MRWMVWTDAAAAARTAAALEALEVVGVGVEVVGVGGPRESGVSALAK